MSDWAVGDLAVCVDASPYQMPSRAGEPWPMAKGSIWRVNWVGLSNRGKIALRFEDEPPLDSGKIGWRPHRFRKILPDEHEACEEEFVTLLKRKRVAA